MEITRFRKENKSDESRKTDAAGNTRRNGIVVATLVATMLPLSPLMEGAALAAPPKAPQKVAQGENKPAEDKKPEQPAQAPGEDKKAPAQQEAKPPQQPAQVGQKPADERLSAVRNFSANVTKRTSVSSLINSDRILKDQRIPIDLGEITVSNVDTSGVEFTVNLTDQKQPSNPPVAKTFRVNYDGTSSGDTEVLGILGIDDLSVEKISDGVAKLSMTYSHVAIDPAVTRNDNSPPAIPPKPEVKADDLDCMINGNEARSDLAGRCRKITLDHDFDLGGNVYSNEAGTAVYASLQYKRLLRFDAGTIWFGDSQPAPFATLSIKPEFNIGNVKGLYYGRVTAMDNMPSYVYTSHALGLGLSQPIGADKNWRLRLGIVGGAAISYPAFDDMYSSISAGASIQYKNWLVYNAATFYWAANTPMETAYIGYYRPRFESDETGLQVTINDYTGRIFANIGVLKDTLGIRASRSIDFGNSVSGDVFVGTGITHWIPELSGKSSFWDGRNDFTAMMGITLVIGGEKMNSTNTIRVEHYQNGGVPQVQTQIATTSNPGPYSFGRGTDPTWNTLINDAKNRINSASSFDGFASSYGGSSQDSLINTARFIGAFMEQVAYANGAEAALLQGKIFRS